MFFCPCCHVLGAFTINSLHLPDNVRLTFKIFFLYIFRRVCPGETVRAFPAVMCSVFPCIIHIYSLLNIFIVLWFIFCVILVMILWWFYWAICSSSLVVLVDCNIHYIQQILCLLFWSCFYYNSGGGGDGGSCGWLKMRPKWIWKLKPNSNMAHPSNPPNTPYSQHPWSISSTSSSTFEKYHPSSPFHHHLLHQNPLLLLLLIVCMNNQSTQTHSQNLLYNYWKGKKNQKNLALLSSVKLLYPPVPPVPPVYRVHH